MIKMRRAWILPAVLLALLLGGCAGSGKTDGLSAAPGQGADAGRREGAGLWESAGQWESTGQWESAGQKESTGQRSETGDRAVAQGKDAPAKKPEKIYSMQIGHSQPVDNPRHQSFLLFKKLLEEKTGGGIQVDIYPAGQLGSEASMLEQVCDGTIQGFRGGQLEIVPKMLVFSLPFLCQDRTEAERLVNSEFAREISLDARKSGATILGIGDAGGLRQFSNSVRMIRRPEDLKGLRMRSNGMDTINKTLEALGAQVMTVPYNDLYMALKAGTIDGQENPWVNSSGMRFYEVQKYFTEVNYQFHPEPFYVNTSWYESLPREYQRILAECTEEMMKENNRLIDENEVQAMEHIRANAEIYTLSREERQAFVEATQVVYEEYMAKGLLTADELARMKRIIKGEER